MRHPRKRVTTAFLVVIAGASWLYLSALQPKEQTRTETTMPTVDYYANEATVLETNQQGKPVYRFHARRVEHKAQDKESVLLDIELDYHAESGERWQAVADEGRIDDDRQQILLNQGVVVTRLADSFPGVIETPELVIYPDSHTASSTAGVVIRQGNNTVTADAMRLNFEQEKLRLRGNVKAHYLPADAG